VDEPVAAAQAPADYTGEPQVRYIKTEVTRKVLEEIYFPFDSAEIRPAGTRVLDKLMDQVRNGTMQKIMVVGYADRVGSAEYNQKLSMRRATAVERALLQRGFPRELIVATGVGETNLPHPTADGVPSARNRVVKIELAVTEVEKKELVD
jgi:OOP family OmpA-OmpF porin